MRIVICWRMKNTVVWDVTCGSCKNDFLEVRITIIRVEKNQWLGTTLAVTIRARIDVSNNVSPPSLGESISELGTTLAVTGTVAGYC
jgi:hypothetical protein